MISIGVLAAKGGVGKSTIATSLAVRAAQDFGRVALVDLDPQHGSARWYSHRIKEGLTQPELFDGADGASDAIESLSLNGYEVAIFDGGPGSLSQTEDAIQSVDFVLSPLRSSDQDLASAEYVVAACREFEKPFMLVINEARSKNDKRALEVRDLLAELLPNNLSPVMIQSRVAFQDAINMGKGASELRGGKEAAEEIDAVWREILKRIKAHQKKAKRHATA